MIKKIKRSDYEGVRTSLQELARSNNWHLSFVSCFNNGIQGQARTGYDMPYEVVVAAPDAISKAAYENPQIMNKLMSLNSDERDRLVAAVNLYQNAYMKDAYYRTDLPDLQNFGIDVNDLVMKKNDALLYGIRNAGDVFDGNIPAVEDQQYES